MPSRTQKPGPGKEAGWFKSFKLPLLAFVYVAMFVIIDLSVENIIRYYIFSVFLVVSSLYFSWYLGGRQTMLYVAFFNVFFAFIFSRIIYITSGVLYGEIFFGKSFLVMYFITIVFMIIMIKIESPADRSRRKREAYIREERRKRNQLELMVATQKLTHDLITQANMVKDELLLLQGAWRSQIHSIINDLPEIKERELYNQIVHPFQESIIGHLRGLESRLSFSPKPVTLDELYAFLSGRLTGDKKTKSHRAELEIRDNAWQGSDRLVIVDIYKVWEIMLNLVRNSQSALELLQIELMKKDMQAYRNFRPRVEIVFDVADGEAVFRVADNGGGLSEEFLSRLFKEPVASRKRGGQKRGQGTMFVKFFGESMGMEIGADRTDRLGGPGLEVSVRMPLTDARFKEPVKEALRR